MPAKWSKLMTVEMHDLIDRHLILQFSGIYSALVQLLLIDVFISLNLGTLRSIWKVIA